MAASRAGKLVRNDSGATAVEFAIVAPIFLALLVGVFNSALLVFTVASLNYAAEKAARCASVNTTQCGDATAISNYADSYYYGVGTAPVFTYAAAACGKSVTGTVTYDFNVVIYSKSISLASSACFP